MTASCRAPRWSPLRVAGGLAALLFVAACSGASSPTPGEYFSRVGALSATLDASGARQPSAPAPALEASLRDFAAGLDGLRPPAAAKVAHHDLTVASKNLADAAGRAAAFATVHPVDAAGVFVRDWEQACHELQDVALAQRIDADLRCVTALPRGAGG